MDEKVGHIKLMTLSYLLDQPCKVNVALEEVVDTNVYLENMCYQLETRTALE